MTWAMLRRSVLGIGPEIFRRSEVEGWHNLSQGYTLISPDLQVTPSIVRRGLRGDKEMWR